MLSQFQCLLLPRASHFLHFPKQTSYCEFLQVLPIFLSLFMAYLLWQTSIKCWDDSVSISRHPQSPAWTRSSPLLAAPLPGTDLSSTLQSCSAPGVVQRANIPQGEGSECQGSEKMLPKSLNTLCTALHVINFLEKPALPSVLTNPG